MSQRRTVLEAFAKEGEKMKRKKRPASAALKFQPPSRKQIWGPLEFAAALARNDGCLSRNDAVGARSQAKRRGAEDAEVRGGLGGERIGKVGKSTDRSAKSSCLSLRCGRGPSALRKPVKGGGAPAIGCTFWFVRPCGINSALRQARRAFAMLFLVVSDLLTESFRLKSAGHKNPARNEQGFDLVKMTTRDFGAHHGALGDEPNPLRTLGPFLFHLPSSWRSKAEAALKLGSISMARRAA